MFSLRQKSRFGGQPIHLFQFQRQMKIWRFCTGDRDLVIGGFTYLSAQIERTALQNTAERAKDKVTITLAYFRNPDAEFFPVTQDLGDNWHPYVPSDPVSVICMATHFGDPDPPVVEWMGVVSQPVFTDVALELTCLPQNGVSDARNQGPKFQKGCWKTVHSTGRRGCNLPLDAFRVDAVLSGVAGLVLTAAEFAAAPLPLLGGWVEWTRPDGLKERRDITHHDGNQVRILSAGPGLANGVAVIARPNCEQTWDACEARGNTDNWGGAFYKPAENPTGGSMSWG